MSKVEDEVVPFRDKPVVYFIGEPRFDTKMYPGHEVAHVYALNHPVWGRDKVRTSSVIKKDEDGFETMNTLYVRTEDAK